MLCKHNTDSSLHLGAGLFMLHRLVLCVFTNRRTFWTKKTTEKTGSVQRKTLTELQKARRINAQDLLQSRKQMHSISNFLGVTSDMCVHSDLEEIRSIQLRHMPHLAAQPGYHKLVISIKESH